MMYKEGELDPSFSNHATSLFNTVGLSGTEAETRSTSRCRPCPQPLLNMDVPSSPQSGADQTWLLSDSKLNNPEMSQDEEGNWHISKSVHLDVPND